METEPELALARDADEPTRALGPRSLGTLPRSGAAVGRLFHRLLALCFLVAWCSLGAQVKTLIGSHGLLPLAAHVEALKAEGLSFRELPTLLWFATSDSAISGGVVLGIALSLGALTGARPRLCFGALTALYLSYAIACRDFLGFQWDNLLVECGALATLLPADRRRPFAHALFRVLLFKLYFESGFAKWRASGHEWLDGGAMSFYFETAPLPTRLAWYAHALPRGMHQLEGCFTLFAELALPVAIFGQRKLRLATFAVFTAFQLVNLATANYGFFCWLSTSLHVFLLDDADIARARRRVSARLGAARVTRARAWLRWLRLRRLGFARPRLPARLATPIVSRLAAAMLVGGYVLVSAFDALFHLAGVRAPAALRPLVAACELASELRVVNTYHLFAAISRDRVEPVLETFDGTSWRERPLRYKPGPVDRAPPFVAPHQPRVDFLLWFYGASFQRGTPEYVGTLVDRVCHDRQGVEALFASPLPVHPEGVRLSFWRYHFTTPAERAATGAWWTRERLGAFAPLRCDAGLL